MFKVFFRIYQARKLGNKEMAAKTKRIFVRPKENLKNNLATQSPPPPYATLYNRFSKNDSNVNYCRWRQSNITRDFYLVQITTKNVS